MIVEYNNVTLALCQLRGWDRVVEMDGPQYLWTRHTIRVSGVYNPKATSYRDNDGTPAQADGRMAPTTDVSIRHALSQPRQTLTISVGGQIVLESPEDDNETDAHNGPTPKVHAIVESIGVKTFLVDWSIEVCVNETPGGTVPIVLSSRWTMEDHIALPHYLTTRVIQGWATLRSDLMLEAGRVPDDFRSALMHPVGTNMQRESIDVAVDDEGTGIEYTLVDQEQMFNIEPAATRLGVTKIEGYHTAEISKPGIEDVVTNVGGSIARGLGSVGFAMTGGIGGEVLGTGMTVPNFISGSVALAGAALDTGITMLGMIPRQTHTMAVRVWGHRNCRKADLESVAASIVFSRMVGTAAGDEVVASCYYSITWDLMGKWVEVQLKSKQGLRALFDFAAGPVGAIAIAGGATAAVTRARATVEELARAARALVGVDRGIMQPRTEFSPNAFSQAPGFPNPVPTNTGGLTGRGSFVGKLLAQVLADANQLQPAPPTPGTGRNTPIA